MWGGGPLLLSCRKSVTKTRLQSGLSDERELTPEKIQLPPPYISKEQNKIKCTRRRMVVI
jgi:hypothetical protein